MTKEQAEFIKIAGDFCEMEFDLRDTYSGRGMFGKQTFGIVAESLLHILSAVVGYLKGSPNVERDSIPQLDDLVVDSMGRNIIVY